MISCQQENILHISGNPNNDLTQILKDQEQINYKIYNSPIEALDQAKENEALIILSTAYPDQREVLNQDFYTKLKNRNIRAFIEFPSIIPDLTLDSTVKAGNQRAIIRDGNFIKSADSLQILSLNGLHFIPVNAERPLIVAAKVAGFDHAIYGLPEENHPLLFQWEDLPVYISTTNLSQFISGRYAPQREWAKIWHSILSHLLPNASISPLEWTATVAPSFRKEKVLPQDVALNSVQRAINWYREARMLVPDNYDEKLQKIWDNKSQHLSWNENIPYGDGSKGVFECIFSSIDESGSQPIGIAIRGDCVSETAMAFASAGQLLDNAEYLSTSKNLLDYYLFHSSAITKGYADPQHGAYGLLPWGISNYAWFKASYGDDNARFILAAITSAALTQNNEWDELLMKSILACLRTTGKKGFRGSRINEGDLGINGWQYYRDREIENYSPHFEAYLWACYLWAYDKTGDEIFLQTAKRGILTMMEKYPHGWTWTNGLAQERARIILPLAWLVRVENTDENKKMLLRVVNDFLKLQDSCGAIREELGELKMGKYPPPQSNDDYGTNEASLIARNGDPVSDLLYTTNFAFLGLHEAAYTTNDSNIIDATDRLADFLCRAQVRSPHHPELDGGWMRAFDFERFEHWGSNADHGWGAWAIETGWTQGWITSIMALRELKTSIWDLTQNSDIAQHYPDLKKQMLND
ncbi:hypothetical protein GCM10025777_08950 [Membranihabitans marinus]